MNNFVVKQVALGSRESLLRIFHACSLFLKDMLFYTLLISTVDYILNSSIYN